jgi:hypothetical protein
MGTPGFITKHLNQTLVYWANPLDDGRGWYTFDDPVEISGRCEYKVELVKTGMGEEKVSRAQVWLDREVQEKEFLCLITLDDIDSNPDPRDVDGSMEVLAFSKIPRLGSSTEFEYKAYMNM